MNVISFLVKLHKDFFLAHHHLLLRFPEIKPWVYFIAEKLDVYVVCVALFLVMWFLWDAAKKESIKRILFIGKEMFHIVFAVGAAWLVSYCMKIFFAAPRPFLRFPGEVDKLFHYGGFNSFPSGHATLFMALAIMISLHHKRIGYVFIFFALIIALARVIAGVHFPIDIFVGWFLGGGISYLIYKKTSF